MAVSSGRFQYRAAASKEGERQLSGRRELGLSTYTSRSGN